MQARKFQRMANSPSFHFLIETRRIARNRPPVSHNSTSFDFLIETGPVGHPLEFEPAKSANPTINRFLSKIDQWLIEGAGDVFLTSPGETNAKVVRNPVLFSGTIFVGLRARINPCFFFTIRKNVRSSSTFFGSDWSKSVSPSSHFQEKSENTKFSKSSVFWDFSLPVFFFFNLGVRPPGRGMFHVTEAGHAKFLRCRRLLERREAAIAKDRTLDHRSMRGSISEDPSHSLDRLRRLKNNRSRPEPSFSSLFASQTTRVLTGSRLRSEVRSMYPRRCCPRGASGMRQPTQDIPIAIAS